MLRRADIHRNKTKHRIINIHANVNRTFYDRITLMIEEGQELRAIVMSLNVFEEAHPQISRLNINNSTTEMMVTIAIIQGRRPSLIPNSTIKYSARTPPRIPITIKIINMMIDRCSFAANGRPFVIKIFTLVCNERSWWRTSSMVILIVAVNCQQLKVIFVENDFGRNLISKQKSSVQFCFDLTREKITEDGNGRNNQNRGLFDADS